MSLLDRFRGQPGWQHGDPSVRVSAVDDLESDAQDLLTEIANEDTDPGVRLAAVTRLSDPAAIGRVAQADPDDDVRDEATAILRAMAVDAAGADADVAAVALSGLSAARDLGEVARTARLEAISRAALDRLDSQKAIGAVARRSSHPSVRLAALDRLEDREELTAVTVKSDHRDIALAAFERLDLAGPKDRDLLKTIAVRARTKPVSRRAKAALTTLETQPVPPTPAELRQQLCERIEALADTNGWDAVSEGLGDAEREWQSLAEPSDAPGSPAADDDDDEGRADVAEPERQTPDAIDDRWARAVARLREHLARLDLARSEAGRRRQARTEALAARAALCDRVARLVADETQDAAARMVEVANTRAEWVALPGLPPAGDETDDGAQSGVERRFAELVASAERQVERQRTATGRLARLTELAAALETVSEGKDLDDLTTRWKGPHAEWVELVRASTAQEVADLVPRVEVAETKRAERLAAAREERRRREQANLAKQQGRCDEFERALADENLDLKEAERWLRLTRSLLGNLGRLPTREDRDTLTKRVRDAQSALTGRLRELRDLVEWKQWANIGIQAALCQRLEALAAVEDDAALAHEFREIMVAWRQASDVPRGEGDEHWQRFKAAHDAVHPRAAAYLVKQDGLRQEHLEQKVALCVEAERLAESTDWIKTAQRMTELQEQWKQVGSTTRKQEREVWNRFRAACGRFFKRRRDDLAERKQVWAKNAQLKEELCGKAEALAEETDLDAAKEAVRRLQADWKRVGPVRRTRSDALWQRFRAGCDHVYSRAQEAVDAEFAEQITARAAVCERLEMLVPESDEAGAEPPPDLAETVATVRAEWRQLPPIPRPPERSLTARFETAVTRVVGRYPAAFGGTELDPAPHLAALERLCEQVEALREDVPESRPGERSPAEILATQLREALASNTMGARVDPEAKRRAEADTVKRLQADRRALGLVPGETGQQLSDRFRAACDHVLQQDPPSAPARGSRTRGDGASGRRTRPSGDSGSADST